MPFPRRFVALMALAGCAASGTGAPGSAADTTAAAERNAAVLRSARAMLATGDCRQAEPRIVTLRPAWKTRTCRARCGSRYSSRAAVAVACSTS